MIWGVVLSLSTSLWAQKHDVVLPKGTAPWEMEKPLSSSQGQLSQGTSRGIPTPPEGNHLRTAAEWEEIEVLTITWRAFPCILKQITAAAVEECRVVIFSENIAQTESYLTGSSCGGAVPMENVEIVDAETNSIWIRDYGANTVYTEYNDGRVLVDWLYNRPRPDDDVIPDVLSSHMGIPLHSAIESPNDLMATGGNWMSDGHGTGFSSELILDENSGGSEWWATFPDHSESDIDDIMSNYHGIDTYVKMNNLPFDGIHHIDMQSEAVG